MNRNHKLLLRRETKRGNCKLVILLSRAFVNYLQTAGTVVALLALLCLVLGNYFASQIITPLGSQVQSTILTTTSIGSTSSVTSAFSCPTHPCSITEIVSLSMGMSESVGGYVSHVIPAMQEHATENVKAWLDNLAIVFLLVSVTLQVLGWFKSRRS